MIFTIDNGLNICSIGLSDIGSYFRFKYPVTTVWYDCRGSVGKYFCTLPYNREYRDVVRQKIISNLDKDFTDDIPGLYEILKPLFPIFKNGEYVLSFYANKEKDFFKYQTSYDNFTQVHFHSLQVVFAEEITDIKKLQEVKAAHKALVKQREHTDNFYTPDLIEFSTSVLYPGDESFYATQPHNSIDQERVKYFEEEIKKGSRPFAIIFNAEFPASDYPSFYYILDGHHKLMAYQKLGLCPPLALLTYLPKDKSEVEFDAEQLCEVLYPWQTEHILKYWSGKDQYIETALQNPASNLHNIIKNGDYEEYHDNGKLKHRAFYNNDKVDGPSRYWYENGAIKSEHYYKKGVRTGTWKDYFRSGKTEFIQPYNDEGNLNGILVSYYENGHIRMEQEFENGRNKDGVSYKTFFETGDRQSELTFKNGKMTVRKSWNSWGEFVNHEVYNPETNQLEKVEITLNDKYDYNSVNYKNRQQEIKNMLQDFRSRKVVKSEEKNEPQQKTLWQKLKALFSG